MSSIYQACRLDLQSHKRHFRCLTVYKGGHGGRLRCRLDVRELRSSDLPPYKAISYAWGSGAERRTIHVNGQKAWVNENAYAVLARLRQEEGDIAVWIDSLCIDQSNVEERSYQVAMMDEIYASAQEVIIWLGQESEHTEEAFSFLEELSYHWQDSQWMTDAYKDPKYHKKWEAVESVFDSNYWERVWVLQECSTNAPRKVYQGRFSTSWANILALNILVVEDTVPPALSPPDELAQMLPVPVTMQREDLRKTRSLTFLKLLAMARYQECTRAHDRVYGILKVFHSEHKFDIPVRYDLPIEQIYRDTAVRLMSLTHSLDVLSYSEPDNTPMKLPSWCPDWHTKRRQAQVLLVYGPNAVSASRNLEATFTIGLGGSTLFVDALVIGRVDKLLAPFQIDSKQQGQLLADQKFDGFLEHIESWISTLCQGNPPGSVEEFQLRKRIYSTLSQQRVRQDINLDLKSLHELDASFKKPGELMEALLRCANRALFTSSMHDLMGMAPDNTREGDCIAVVKGCCVPLIVRENQSTYTLVGETFVGEIMYGEALDFEIPFERIAIE